MNTDLEHSFVEQIQRHQNIVHKVCRLYTNNEDAHNDLFQEITIQLWKWRLNSFEDCSVVKKMLWHY